MKLVSAGIIFVFNYSVCWNTYSTLEVIGSFPDWNQRRFGRNFMFWSAENCQELWIQSGILCVPLSLCVQLFEFTGKMKEGSAFLLCSYFLHWPLFQLWAVLQLTGLGCDSWGLGTHPSSAKRFSAWPWATSHLYPICKTKWWCFLPAAICLVNLGTNTDLSWLLAAPIDCKGS